MNTTGIEINEKFKKALDIMNNSSKNIFITGRAGTGKSTLLDYFRNTTAKNVVVLAPTGVSALNVRGETIHSFFGFKPDITAGKIKKVSEKKAAIFKKLDAIIIDEISMVRADLMDYMDIFLRLNGRAKAPFGGIQMIFIGDLYQLPPVVTSKEKEIFRNLYASPYFFASAVFREIEMEFIELEKIYRQKDEKFIEILNSVRNNTIGDKGLENLNKRVGVGFKNENYLIHLTPLNRKAAEINGEKLLSLGKKIHSFTAEIEGNFEKNSYPADYELEMSECAQVMFLNNDSRGRWVNGTLGIVRGIEYDKDAETEEIMVKLEDGNLAGVLPNSWKIFHYRYNGQTKKIETETLGIFTQYPLKLAWALTIHKSQGKTYKKVSIDLKTGTFAHGQAYVALSRCVSIEGLSLKSPVKKSHILMDWRVVNFLTEYQYKKSDKQMPLSEKEKIIKDAIKGKKALEIIYLKKDDEKSRRVIEPAAIEQLEYKGFKFEGLRAWCHSRKEERTFKIERILEMKPLGD